METDCLTQLVIFHLRSREFALPVNRVAEVLRMVALTPVPEAPSWMPGVMNLRGFVIPVVDLRTRLGMAPATPNLNTPIIVVAVDGQHFGLIVDTMVEVLNLPAEAVEHFAAQSAECSVVGALARTGQRVIMILDVQHLHAGVPALV